MPSFFSAFKTVSLFAFKPFSLHSHHHPHRNSTLMDVAAAEETRIRISYIKEYCNVVAEGVRYAKTCIALYEMARKYFVGLPYGALPDGVPIKKQVVASAGVKTKVCRNANV